MRQTLVTIPVSGPHLVPVIRRQGYPDHRHPVMISHLGAGEAGSRQIPGERTMMRRTATAAAAVLAASLAATAAVPALANATQASIRETVVRGGLNTPRHLVLTRAGLVVTEAGTGGPAGTSNCATGPATDFPDEDGDIFVRAVDYINDPRIDAGAARAILDHNASELLGVGRL
jgi:hypothetical protein